MATPLETLQSSRRIMNHVAKRLELGSKADTLHYFPTKVTIETGNICNLRCPLCPTGTDETKVSKGFLTFENFKKIIGQIGLTAETLDFFDWGEPFLNKDLLKMIRFSKEQFPHLKIIVSSNLNIPQFSPEGAEEVVRSGLDRLVMSIDGVTQAVYEKYRVGGNVEETFKAIRWLVAAKKKLGAENPSLLWNYLVFRHNEHEVEKARAMAKKFGVEFSAGGMRTDCGEEIFLPMDERLKKDASWIPENPRYSQYTVEHLSSRKRDCTRPWTTVAINWDGYVVPCGSVYDAKKYNYGNMFKESFAKVWNSKPYRLARQALANKTKGTGTICETCKNNGFPLL